MHSMWCEVEGSYMTIKLSFSLFSIYHRLDCLEGFFLKTWQL